MKQMRLFSFLLTVFLITVSWGFYIEYKGTIVTTAGKNTSTTNQHSPNSLTVKTKKAWVGYYTIKYPMQFDVELLNNELYFLDHSPGIN